MNRLKELRQQNKMTLLEVAKKLGVTESTVQRYESGVIENLKYDTIVKLSNLYKTTPAYLMGWAEEYASQKNGYSNASDASALTKLKAALGLPLSEEEAVKGISVSPIEILIQAWLNLSDEGQAQLIQYAKFLESQEDK